MLLFQHPNFKRVSGVCVQECLFHCLFLEFFSLWKKRFIYLLLFQGRHREAAHYWRSWQVRFPCSVKSSSHHGVPNYTVLTPASHRALAALARRTGHTEPRVTFAVFWIIKGGAAAHMCVCVWWLYICIWIYVYVCEYMYVVEYVNLGNTKKGASARS